MVEGGHDPELDLDESEEEATPAFASLTDLECHLPPTPPQNDPWSVSAQQQQQQSKPHRCSVRAGRRARADHECRAQEKEERAAQHQRRAESESSHPAVTTGAVSSPINRCTWFQRDDILRRVARVPINCVRLPRCLQPPPGAGRGVQLLALVMPPPLLEPPHGWDYGDARPIGSRRPDELTTDYRQALIDAWARFPTRRFPDLPDVADLDLPLAVVCPRMQPAPQPVNPLPIQMAM